MNVSFNSFSNYAISSLKEAIFPSLSAQNKKILMIASFALGCLVASLAAYYAVRHYSFKATQGAKTGHDKIGTDNQAENVEVEPDPLKTEQDIIEPKAIDAAPPPYSTIGQEALAFAREKLKEHSEIKACFFKAGWTGDKTHQPVNPEIALLTTLYWDVYSKAFYDAIKQNKEDPWSKQEVIKAADECMKIVFAISCLTLDDLPAFTQNLASKNIERTYAKALAEQDSYQYRTFYYCSFIYHDIRGGLTWGINWDKQEDFVCPEPGELSESYVEPFYDDKQGKIQNTWNALYNEYCDRVRQYVSEEELRKADNRHKNWTQKDIKGVTFYPTPDTTPT